jgi:hypothetical protein
VASKSPRYDSDERFNVDSDPEAAIKEVLDGSGTEGEGVEMDEDEPEDES